MKKLILASVSSRRAKLLELADLSFVVMPSYASEDFNESESPEEIVQQLAYRKASAANDGLTDKKDTWIIGSDTIVVMDNEILNKPHDYEEAFDMLKRLSGKTHNVITGVCILNEQQIELFYETTAVVFYDLTEDQIDYYLQNYQPYDKAGAYAIQEWIGAVGIKEIKGDYYNVMGLPLSLLIKKLGSMGFPMPFDE